MQLSIATLSAAVLLATTCAANAQIIYRSAVVNVADGVLSGPDGGPSGNSSYDYRIDIDVEDFTAYSDDTVVLRVAFAANQYLRVLHDAGSSAIGTQGFAQLSHSAVRAPLIGNSFSFALLDRNGVPALDAWDPGTFFNGGRNGQLAGNVTLIENSDIDVFGFEMAFRDIVGKSDDDLPATYSTATFELNDLYYPAVANQVPEPNVASLVLVALGTLRLSRSFVLNRKH